MSQITYTKKWANANAELNRVLLIERPVKQKPFTSDRELSFSDLSVRYIKYIKIYRSLQDCYDHMIQPQKRILLARCLEGVAGRIVELHTELVRLRIAEYINLVSVCINLKLNPEQLELTLSKSTYINRVQELRQRAVLLEYILETMGGMDAKVAEENFYTMAEAIALIQRNERCFIARRKAKAVKKAKMHLRKVARVAGQIREVNVAGIIKFQALWKRYRIRKSIGFIRHENDIFLGMVMPVCRDLTVRDKEIEEQDFEKAQVNDDYFKTDTIVKTERYMDTQGPVIAQNMKLEIMQWIIEYRDLFGTFPQFPTEEEGGSLTLFTNKSIQDVEDDLDDLMDPSSKPKDNKEDKKENKKEDKKGKPVAQPFETKPSKYVDTELIPCAVEYDRFWRDKPEVENPKQRYDANLLMEDIHANTEAALRKQVDELIREELEKLEKGIDAIIPREVKKKKKEKKEKKKKAPKDPTAGVPLEDLFKELVLEGVIKRVALVKLKEFKGSMNLMSPTDSSTVEFSHDLGDIRKMIIDYALLPMSSETIHQRAPFKKSLLLVGPHGSGKRMLVSAICTELGANLIDLSPDNIAGKYTDKAGQKRLMHLVAKVGKMMEPSVIHIGNCDRMFTKKLPPEDDTKPARLKGDLMKLIKGITPNDRILIIGTTSYPFKAAIGPLFKLYETLIYINVPTCSSRFMLWTKFILDFRGVIHAKLDISSLAKVSQGFTAGDIRNAVMEVLTEKRQKRQPSYPLSTYEFVGRLASFSPVHKEEVEAFDVWLLKTPMTKKRHKVEIMEADGLDVADIL